jgi:hypothetical protein
MELIYWPGAGCHNSTRLPSQSSAQQNRPFSCSMTWTITGPEPFQIAGPDEDAAETLDPLHESSEIPPGTDL